MAKPKIQMVLEVEQSTTDKPLKSILAPIWSAKTLTVRYHKSREKEALGEMEDAALGCTVIERLEPVLDPGDIRKAVWTLQWRVLVPPPVDEHSSKKVH